jgi:hypothetical protein
MTATVAHVYDQLPPDQRARACIFTANYGEASALNLLGASYHLPPAISGHNNYFVWGPGACDGSVILTVGLPLAQTADPYIRLFTDNYASVVQAATIACNYCQTQENDIPVYICTRPAFSNYARDLWPRLRHFD